MLPEGLGSNLASNPHPKLRSMILDLGYIRPRGYNSSLLALNPELRQLGANNILEVLEVNAEGAPDIVWTPGAKDWATDFDQLVTDIVAFSALRQVTVNLICNMDRVRRRNDHHPWEMTEAWFPQLQTSATIEFMLCTSRKSRVDYESPDSPSS